MAEGAPSFDDGRHYDDDVYGAADQMSAQNGHADISVPAAADGHDGLVGVPYDEAEAHDDTSKSMITTPEVQTPEAAPSQPGQALVLHGDPIGAGIETVNVAVKVVPDIRTANDGVEVVPDEDVTIEPDRAEAAESRYPEEVVVDDGTRTSDRSGYSRPYASAVFEAAARAAAAAAAAAATAPDEAATATPASSETVADTAASEVEPDEPDEPEEPEEEDDGSDTDDEADDESDTDTAEDDDSEDEEDEDEDEDDDEEDLDDLPEVITAEEALGQLKERLSSEDISEVMKMIAAYGRMFDKSGEKFGAAGVSPERIEQARAEFTRQLRIAADRHEPSYRAAVLRMVEARNPHEADLVRDALFTVPHLQRPYEKVAYKDDKREYDQSTIDHITKGMSAVMQDTLEDIETYSFSGKFPDQKAMVLSTMEARIKTYADQLRTVSGDLPLDAYGVPELLAPLYKYCQSEAAELGIVAVPLPLGGILPLKEIDIDKYSGDKHGEYERALKYNAFATALNQIRATSPEGFEDRYGKLDDVYDAALDGLVAADVPPEERDNDTMLHEFHKSAMDLVLYIENLDQWIKRDPKFHGIDTHNRLIDMRSRAFAHLVNIRHEQRNLMISDVLGDEPYMAEEEFQEAYRVAYPGTPDVQYSIASGGRYITYQDGYNMVTWPSVDRAQLFFTILREDGNDFVFDETGRFRGTIPRRTT